MYVDVAVPLAVPQTFTYSVSEELRLSARAGCRVLVPFQNRHLIGLIAEVREQVPPGRYKPLVTHRIVRQYPGSMIRYTSPGGAK